jgi:AcrR family transcriptional regulator
VPGIYHHWPTKQHLLVALLDRTMEDLLERARAARAEGLLARALLRTGPHTP